YLGYCQYKLGLEGEGSDQATQLLEEAATTFRKMAQRFPTGSYSDQALYFQGDAYYHAGRLRDAE
ncbi:MAG: hypothetical protein GTO62_04530, partial [Planctomycetales bacterium]|nr:hypothetical protein [Planctomycetales bacterium]NIP68522.1 hypothetical protein [Planctomycetales bacterium]